MNSDKPTRQIGAIVEESEVFTFVELCRATGAVPTDLIAWVGEGVLDPAGDSVAEWRFGGRSLARVRTAVRLARDLELDPMGVALVLDLLDEIAALRAQLRRSEGHR